MEVVSSILLTSVGRRNYLVSKFVEAAKKYKVIVICIDLDPNAAALTQGDLHFLSPRITDKDYPGFLTDIIEKYNVKLVVPLNDLDIPVMSSLKNNCADNVIISGAPKEMESLASDKMSLHHALIKVGLNSPQTYLTIADFEKNLNIFPAIVKPRYGSGSIGTFIVKDLEDLRLHFDLSKNAINASVLKGFPNDENVVIQELVGNTEYGIDLLLMDQRVVGKCTKQKLAMRSGETDKCKTVSSDSFSFLDDFFTGYDYFGNIDVDVRSDGDKQYLIDVNPRFGGGYPFSHESGAHHVDMMVEYIVKGCLPSKYDYSTEKVYAKYDQVKLVRVD